jgi:hypothetical protein
MGDRSVDSMKRRKPARGTDQEGNSAASVIARQRAGVKGHPMIGSAKRSISPAVIASEATQSMRRQKKQEWIASLRSQ